MDGEKLRHEYFYSEENTSLVQQLYRWYSKSILPGCKNISDDFITSKALEYYSYTEIGIESAIDKFLRN